MTQLRQDKFRLCTLFLSVLLYLAGVTAAFGQVAASITGKVEDSSGAAIPGANVTVTSTETGATRAVTTDDTGNFRVLSLAVGLYELRVEKTGFKIAVQSGVNLVVGQQAVVNLKLEVGEVQQEVTITGDAPLVNTTTAEVTGLVGEQAVKDLPLNGRSFDQLITLNAGAVNYNSNRAAGQLGNVFTVEGRRPSENFWLLNGIEYTGEGTVSNSPLGASSQLLGIDAVREFTVVSSTYGAEYGKRAGAQVNVVTQSGTNQLHGSLFEFLRNSALDARNFFDFPPGLRIPPFRRNQFGGAMGGPIRKDKTFIFGNYEGFRQRLGVSDVSFVPDAAARQGLLPNAQGVAVPVAGLNPRILPYFAMWPAPNGPELGNAIAENFSNPEQSIREDFGNMRFDQTLSDRNSLGVAYTFDDGHNLTPTADPFWGTTSAIRNQILSVQETHIFSPQLINLATIGMSRVGYASISTPLVSFPANLSFTQGDPVGSIIISGGESATQASGITTADSGGANPAQRYHKTLFTYGDGLQLIRGKHTISGGVWFQRIRADENAVSRAWGQASFATLTTFLQGTSSTFSYASGSSTMGWRSWEGAWYLQDSVQLRPNLNIRFGLRHEFTNGWSEATGRAAHFPFVNGLIQSIPVVGNSPLTQNNSKWLFAPRVGLAWDPFGKGKTSIRAGFGTYYNLVDSLGYYPDSSPPLNGSASVSNVSLFSVIPIIPGAAIAPSCGPNVPAPCTTYSPKGVVSSYKTPGVESYSLTMEQQLNSNTALRVSYIGSEAHHLFVNVDPNAIPAQICNSAAGCLAGGIGSARSTVPQGATYIPVQSTRPDPYLTYGIFQLSEGNSNYNALQVELTRRLAKGLQARFNYTWSKNLDNLSGVAATQSENEAQTIMNLSNLRQDWGPSALNITNQFSGNFSYELPIGTGKAWMNGVTGAAAKLISGWQFNGIVTLLSGFPLTPQLGQSRSGDGNSNYPDRPSINPSFTGPVKVGSPSQWFNPNAFVMPAAGTYGTLGRGTLRGPGLVAADISLFKNTKISERVGLQFRAEAFNFLNHANFGLPNLALFSGSTISTTAGVISATATTSRQLQFGMKLIF